MSVVGELPQAEENLYHQRRLNALRTDPRGAWFANKLSPLLLPPLVMGSWALARLVGMKKNPQLSQLATHFTEHYSPSLYPTLAKTLELHLLRSVSFEEPSLEVGVGDGYFSQLLYGDRPFTLAGDMIFETLLAARKKGIARHAAVMDADALPLPDNCLRSYFMNNLIHHLPDKQRTLDEAFRVLQPGGTFVFTDSTLNWASQLWHIRLARTLGFEAWSQRKLLEKLENCAQALVPDPDWWRRVVNPSRWQVVTLTPFFSVRNYFLASLIESLCFKQGGPMAPVLLRKFLRVPFASTVYRKCLPDLVERMLCADSAWCQSGGSVCCLVVLRKLPQEVGENGPAELVCPATRQVLGSPTARAYPEVQGIPILLPYWEKLPHYREHLERMSREGYHDYLT